MSISKHYRMYRIHLTSKYISIIYNLDGNSEYVEEAYKLPVEY